jgi:hypothetical protein
MDKTKQEPWEALKDRVISFKAKEIASNGTESDVEVVCRIGVDRVPVLINLIKP